MCSKPAPAKPRPPALAVAGVTKSGGASASAGIGGLVLVTSHGFHGATIASRHGIAMTAIAGDGTGMERDYDFSSTLHAVRPRKRASDRTPRRRARGQAAQPAQGRHAPRAGRVRFQDLRFAGRSSRQRRQRQLDRAQDEFLAGKTRREDFCLRHRHRRRSAATARACARGRSTPKASPAASASWSRTACLRPGCSTARPRANSIWKPPVTPSAAFPRRPRPDRATCISPPGSKSPDQLIADIEDGFYITDMIGMGVNLVTGDYSRGASGFWIENGERTYPVSEVTIAGHLADMFASLDAGERPRLPLRHQCADAAR